MSSDGRRVIIIALTPRQWRAIGRATGLADKLAMVGAMMEVDLDTETGRYEARDAIAAKEREVASTKAAVEARFAELKTAQAARGRTVESLESREQALSDNLASITSQMAGAGGEAPSSAPAPLTAGESAHYIAESQASVPSGAPSAAIPCAISCARSFVSS